MGEIADDMLDGNCCALCGQYFDSGKTTNGGTPIVHTHGYPVACWDCFEPDPDCCGYPKAEKPTF